MYTVHCAVLSTQCAHRALTADQITSRGLCTPLNTPARNRFVKIYLIQFAYNYVPLCVDKLME